jgi:hypothetical protein
VLTAKRVAVVAGALLLVVTLLGLALALVPPLLVPGGTIDASERSRLLSESAIRSTTVQLVAGVVVVFGIVYTAAQFRISRETHYTDRYTKAIDQLGHESEVVRLGGIFALQRLALNSRVDHPTVTEILNGYLRAVAPKPQSPGVPPISTEKPQMRPDVQAALTVLVDLHGGA